MWPLHDTLIPPLSFFVLFPDEAGVLPERCNFTLSDHKGWIGIGYGPDHLLDAVVYACLEGSRTYGRYPSGAGDFTLMPASFFARNHPSAITSFKIRIYPNPAKETVFFEGVVRGDYLCRLYSANGTLYREMQLYFPNNREQSFSVSMDITNIPAGLYIVYFTNGQMVNTKKLIIYE